MACATGTSRFRRRPWWADPAVSARGAIESEVRVEMMRQDEKWGQQNHADGTGPQSHPLALAGGAANPGPCHISAASLLSGAFTANTDERFHPKDGSTPSGTWKDVLLEEVFEALAEDDEVKLQTELIQVAAVAEQWVAAIRRRRAARDVH